MATDCGERADVEASSNEISGTGSSDFSSDNAAIGAFERDQREIRVASGLQSERVAEIRAAHGDSVHDTGGRRSTYQTHSKHETCHQGYDRPSL